MEIVAIFFWIIFAVALVFGPTVLVVALWVRLKRLRTESEDRFSQLTRRLFQVEQSLRDLPARPVAPAATAAAQQPQPSGVAQPAAAAAKPVADVPVAPAPPVLTPPAPPVAPPVPVMPSWPKPAAQPVPAPAKPLPPPSIPPPAALPDRPVIAEPARAAASVSAPSVAPRIAPPSTPPPPPARSGMEELIAGNWLVFIGIALLVFGIAFGLSIAWERLGPSGKVAVGMMSGLALLGGGIWLEKKPRYRLFARAGIGGGWAVLFFVTYAMHHLPATRIIASQALDLVLLLGVAAAMVAHTLRYNSQVVTGLAFLLAFSTVTISRVNVYSLGASAILALALIVIVGRRRWFELEVFGILASYLNHWFWLRGIIEPMGGQKHMFPEFGPSAAILLLYWAAYRASYVLRSIDTEDEERVSTVAALLNTFLLMFVVRYQSVQPKYAFYFLLGLGAAEFTLGLVTRARARRAAFVVLSTVGASLLVGAFPFKFSGGDLSVIWLLAAEAFFIAGVFMDELLFRRFGRIAEIVVAVQLFYSHPLDAPKSLANASVFILAAILFGANSHLVPWRWPKIFETRWEQFGAKLISWLGAAMAATAIWLSVPEAWVAVGWALLAFWLALAGSKLAQRDLSYQGNVVALLATAGALIINLNDDRIWHGLTMRLVTVPVVAALLYATARFSALPKATAGWQLRPAYTWAAALLVSLLALDEVAAAWVPVIWMLFALALAFIGQRRKLHDFVLQAGLLAALSWVYTLLVNTLHGEVWQFGITLRLATTALVTAALYLQTRWADIEEWPWTHHLGTLQAWGASFLVAWLMWYELLPVSVAVGWALFGAGLLEVGVALPESRKYWRAQAYVALGAAFLRLFFVNLNAAGAPGEISARVYTTLPVALALFYAYGRLETADGANARALTRRASPLFAWMGTLAVVALVRFELPPDWVVAAWASLVVVLLAVAWRSGRRTFTAQALLLGLAIAFRTAMHNFYARSYFAQPTWQERWLPVGVTIALLFMALYPAFRVRQLARAADTSAPRRRGDIFLRRPEQLTFFIATGLLTVLLYLESNAAMVTVAWGVEAVLIFIFALLVGERSFRLTGLALLLLGVAKIVFFDIIRFNAAQKALTFVVVGLVALGISLLYTRYKDALKDYL